MKALLVVSLILNIVLGVLYFQEKSKPPLERIILDRKVERVFPEINSKKKLPGLKAERESSQESTEADPTILVHDEQSFAQASEEIENSKKHFLEDHEISEQAMKKKEKLTQDFYQQTGAIYQKYPMGMGLNFQERRKVIELEEKLHQDYEKLLGKKKWEQYRKFVDDYNLKLIKNHKSREFSPLMMGY
ncbi:MAG: hypothetical protein H0V66_11250 [Bdellovibrionales bacterium]|nr:hypothetical protein [Bdellovibrionales bacterium]